MAEEILEIIVDDGRRAIPIKNTIGEQIGTFYFNPTDIGIIRRFGEVSDRFPEVVEPLSNVNIDENGKGTTEDEMKVLDEAKERLYDLCNYLFGGNYSEAFFGGTEPFSPSDGNFYCVTALNTVAEFVSKQFNKETEKISKKVDKYTHGVRSGKHKDGRK